MHHAIDEGYVALQTWICGQLHPHAAHAQRVFTDDPSCLYDVFLSALVGNGMGFTDFEDNRCHHGLYAFDFFIGDFEVPSIAPTASRLTGECSEHAFCHAITDTWLGTIENRHLPFVSSVTAAIQAISLVADTRVDTCIFQFDLPAEYARTTAPPPWEKGKLPVGVVDSSLLAVGPSIHFHAHASHSQIELTPPHCAQILAQSAQMGLVCEAAEVNKNEARGTFRAPHTQPEIFGWVADAVARTFSTCGHTGGMRIQVQRERFALQHPDQERAAA